MNSLQLCYSFNTLPLLSRLGKNLLPIAFAAKNDVPVKKEMLSPVKTCSFDEQIKGSFPLYFTIIKKCVDSHRKFRLLQSVERRAALLLSSKFNI